MGTDVIDKPGASSRSPEFCLTLYPDGRIRKMEDAMTRILGWKAEDVFGLAFSTLLPLDAQNRMDMLWEKAAELDGVTMPRVPLRHQSGNGYINFDIGIAADADAIALTVFKPAKTAAKEPVPEPEDTEAFFAFVESVVNGGEAGAAGLAMVNMPGLVDGSVSADKAAELRAGIEDTLRQKAVGGKIGRLDDAAYAFLTEDKFDQEELEKDIAKTTKRLEVNAAELGLVTQGLEVDQKNIDPKVLRNALNHARGVFLGEVEGREEHTLTDMINGIEHHRRLILSALKEHGFRTTPREIRDGRTNTQIGVLHQPKMIIDTKIRFAGDLIVLRDHADVAAEHDLTIFTEFLRLFSLQEDEKRARRPRAFFELCVVNLADAGFIGKLLTLTSQYAQDARGLGFRIRHLPSLRAGGAAWQGLDRLVEAGFFAWIDRFADVVTDEGLMQKVQGGMVEVSAKFLDRIAGHPDGRGLTMQLIDVWQSKGVTLLSADLETDERKLLAHELGLYIALADGD